MLLSAILKKLYEISIPFMLLTLLVDPYNVRHPNQKLFLKQNNQLGFKVLILVNVCINSPFDFDLIPTSCRHQTNTLKAHCHDTVWKLCKIVNFYWWKNEGCSFGLSMRVWSRVMIASVAGLVQFPGAWESLEVERLLCYGNVNDDDGDGAADAMMAMMITMITRMTMSIDEH